jgi:hypothetical protein
MLIQGNHKNVYQTHYCRRSKIELFDTSKGLNCRQKFQTDKCNTEAKPYLTCSRIAQYEHFGKTGMKEDKYQGHFNNMRMAKKQHKRKHVSFI